MRKVLWIILGCTIASIGVLILRHSHVVTGGTAGLSLSLSYAFPLSFAVIFFLINIPFYLFSFFQMGWKFTTTTIGSVSLLSLLTSLDHLLPSFTLPSLMGAVTGGLIAGLGLSILFMNETSLGGANILALFAQRKFGWDPGKVNFSFDFLVVLSSMYSIGLSKGIFSVMSIAITGFIISYFKQKIALHNQPTPDSTTQPLDNALSK
ncbi:YitT family protein [Priestia megaterium]|uniref:YitT family protein n=1 Tax=Priestia megaterium TaxID=1404 RepID=UPI002A6B7B0D|nr:YitT family protein [Priestia megaterium]MDY0942770.1 YitT family protein [Priestia megaterium]